MEGLMMTRGSRNM